MPNQLVQTTMSPTVCLVVIATTHNEVQLTPAVTDVVDELVVIINPKARFGGMGAIANRVLDRTACDVVGLIHADTTWGLGDIDRLAGVVVGGNVAGIVGCALEPQPYTTNNNGLHHIVWGHKIPDDREIDVSTLDACTIFLRHDMGVRFDTQTFDMFHCCVEDVCLTAAKNGARILVPNVKADHIGTNRAPVWGHEYARYRQKLVEKHRGTFFRTTTG